MLIGAFFSNLLIIFNDAIYECVRKKVQCFDLSLHKRNKVIIIRLYKPKSDGFILFFEHSLNFFNPL